MSRRFKRKLKLRKNISNYLNLIIILFILIFMQNSKILKQVISTNANRYVKKTYVKNINRLKSKTGTSMNNDEIFLVKEEKDSKPLIYIYNTHQTEAYQNSSDLFTPTVVHAAKYLSELFNQNGLPSIFENRSINEILSAYNLSYGSSYKVSRMYLEEEYKKNNTLKYFFDIHRDAGSHSYTTICISDKCYAKILFLIGLENPNYLENQKYAEELNKRLNSKVDGISKGILQKQGKNVNGVYNQDFSSRTILIELGGENNTLDEVYNTLNILSEVLIEYIKEEINYGR